MSRTPKDYAIEHAEYMAVEAEQLIDALNDLGEIEALREESDNDDGDIEGARGAVNERMLSLLSGIYEFRKRRDRAIRGETGGSDE